jgi:hypothetical protein
MPDGVYAVRRESIKQEDVLPLKEGEMVVVNRHRYLKNDANEPPRFLVVRSAPTLDLANDPKAVKAGTEVVRIAVKI